MNHIEAMKQALEYIEATNKSSSFWMVPASELNKTVNALRQAIEQASSVSSIQSDKTSDAEKQEPVAWQACGVFFRLRDLIPEHLLHDAAPLFTTPQPQREQVMYQLSPTDIYDFAGWLTTRKGLMQVGGAYEAGPMAEAVGEYLKTFPERFATIQREWVGLTDEEIRLLKLVCVDLVKEKGWGFLDWNWFARAIEAKLKEKNSAT